MTDWHHLYVIFIILSTTSLVHVWLVPQIGELLPDDPYVYVSNTLTLKCILKNSSENSSSLYFKDHYGNRFDDSHVIIINAASAKLILNISGIENSGRYKCWSGQSLVGAQSLSVEYYPQKIVNFSCTVHNWEYWECTWSHPVDYIDRNNINISLLYTFPFVNKYATCPVLSFEKCLFQNDNTLEMQHHINVTVKNMRTGDAAVFSQTVINDNIVKPAPALGYNVSALSSECIYVQWRHSATGRTLLFKIMVQLNDEKVSEHNKTTMVERSSTVITKNGICNLNPYTEYQVSITSIPLVLNASFIREPTGYWSETVTSKVITNESVPAGAAVIPEGLYTSKPSSVNIGYRTIIINWKAPEKHLQNGIITGYRIQVCPLNENKCHPTVFSTQYSRIFLNMNQNITYNITLSARTSIGYSKSVSTVTVSSEEEALTQPKHFIAARQDVNGSFFTVLEWNVTETQTSNMTEYIVVWCLPDESQGICKINYQINWMSVGLATSANITMEEAQSPLNYLYGVYARENDKSSGIVWSSCVYIKSEVPKDPPVVQLPVDTVQDQSVKVTWRPPDCGKSKAYIKEYILKYCPSMNKECIEEMRNLTVVADGADLYIYKLKNLNAESHYRISMISVAEAGLSPESAAVYAVPAPPVDTLTEDEVIAISSATAGACILFGIIIFFVLRRTGCCSWLKKFHKKVTAPIDIKIPAVPDDLKSGYADIDDYMMPNNLNHEDADSLKIPFIRRDYNKVVDNDEDIQDGKLAHQDSGTGTMTPPVDDYSQKAEIPTFKVNLDAVIENGISSSVTSQAKSNASDALSSGETGIYLRYNTSDSEEASVSNNTQMSETQGGAPFDSKFSFFQPPIQTIQVENVIQHPQKPSPLHIRNKKDAEVLELDAVIEKAQKHHQLSKSALLNGSTEIRGFVNPSAPPFLKTVDSTGIINDGEKDLPLQAKERGIKNIPDIGTRTSLLQKSEDGDYSKLTIPSLNEGNQGSINTNELAPMQNQSGFCDEALPKSLASNCTPSGFMSHLKEEDGAAEGESTWQLLDNLNEIIQKDADKGDYCGQDIVGEIDHSLDEIMEKDTEVGSCDQNISGVDGYSSLPDQDSSNVTYMSPSALLNETKEQLSPSVDMSSLLLNDSFNDSIPLNELIEQLQECVEMSDVDVVEPSEHPPTKINKYVSPQDVLPESLKEEERIDEKETMADCSNHENAPEFQVGNNSDFNDFMVSENSETNKLPEAAEKNDTIVDPSNQTKEVVNTVVQSSSSASPDINFNTPSSNSLPSNACDDYFSYDEMKKITEVSD